MDNHDVSSTPGAFRLRWDVFLSFRGEDTRHSFIRNLYESLEKHGIRVFRDDDGLRRGDEIAPSLLEAIENSAASIVIISPNYANSRWCLNELVKICDCRRLILPVFYQVDPSDVRQQKGRFEEDFKILESNSKKDDVDKWKTALEKVVGGIPGSGWVFRDSDEEQEKLIQSLLTRVLTELGNTPVGGATYTVGLDSHLEKLMSFLDVKSNSIQVLGLHGKGGVGKTTLAKALYNKLFGQFERHSFISNVCKISAKDYGLASLQNKLINDLSPNKVPVDEVSAGVTAIKGILHEDRVLIVLDNVDNERQLEALTGRREWFYEGSRIIITTRDREALPKHLVNQFYEVRELETSEKYSEEALQLFSYHALRREKPPDSFFNLSKQIVSRTGGSPLALEVFGSLLFNKRTEEWEDALQKLKQIRPGHLLDVLQISFDGLDEQEKCIFLDIACLFIKMEMTREDAIDVLKGCGFGAEIAITNLTEKSLIKVTEDNTLWMHDEVRDMGMQIVLDENRVNPGMRSRLWDRNEIMSVLKNEKGTENVQGIVLDFKRRPVVKYVENNAQREREVILCTQHFELMVNLRLLQINHLRLEGKYKYLPAGLKWLQWKECPLKALPSDFCPRELAVLDLSESGIEHVWGRHSNKVAEKLMVMNLRGCYNLAAIPDLSGHRTLEKLVLEGCHRLTNIHESIGNVSTLLHLNLRDCSKLVEFSTDVSGLKHVENLILSGCSKLKELPKNIGSMKSLKELLVDNTAIAELPESIFRLTKLEKLSLNDCQFFRRLPKSFGKLCSLKELSLHHSAIEEIPDSVGSLSNLEKLNLCSCESLTAIPDSVGNLTSLTELLVNNTPIKELPASIGSLSFLKNLSVQKCQLLTKLPDSIEGLASLVELQLDETPITNLPDQVGTLKILKKLDMRNCRYLRSLPESIGSMLGLTTLNLSNSLITELPESIGMLENLILLRMNQCKQLCKLPASIGKLKSLQHLHMEETAVTELPESFGMLSSLMTLKMNKKTQFAIPSTQEKSTSAVLPTSFSNLCLLKELGARAWKISGKIPDDFERLSSLEILDLSHNDFCSLPSSLRGLSILKKLILHHCVELKSLPPLPSSLVEVNVANCTSLESMSDLSNLKHLRNLNLTNCEKVVDVPGLECLKSLRMFCMSGCKACSFVVKRRLSKVCLRNLFGLSMPGSKIPDWFSLDEVRFSNRKNYEIRGVIIGVVVSVNHQIPNDLRDKFPVIPGILATIVKLNRPIFKTMLPLTGVPKTQDNHLYLCRYPAHHPLVSMLEDGCRLQVTKEGSSFFEGTELKKFGIHLIFEGDDDYDGDEDTLDESQQSISEKLTKFFSSLEDEEDHISESGREVEIEVQEIEEQEERGSTWLRFFQLFRRCFCFLKSEDAWHF